jgi:hypothetical protein
VIAETGEVIHSRLRGGKASSGRGASSFARQALARLKRLGLIAEIVVRADSGFYAEKVVAACPRARSGGGGTASSSPPGVRTSTQPPS